MNTKTTSKNLLLKYLFPKIGEAYRLKELFKQIFDNADQLESIQDLKEWMKIAATSKLVTIQQFLNTLQSH
ncbi:MAG: transposase [Saprospiraceae bacterium]|nr:transposase [Saprospiraceae bacterium]